MDPLLDSWELHLRALNRSPNTISGYLADADRLDRWLQENRPGTALVDVEPADVKAYLASKVEAGRKPASVAHYYRSLQQLFRWLHDEEEIPVDPMAKVGAPHVPDQEIPTISLDDMLALVKTVSPRKRRKDDPPADGKFDWEDHDRRRDHAMILLLGTTGIRAGGIMGLNVGHINMRAREFKVIEKGDRDRTVGLLMQTAIGSPAEAVDRYLRVRRRHPKAEITQALWLGRQGRFTDWGLRQMLDRRGTEAGIGHIHPHQFRHTFAHTAKAAGMSDEELMEIGGWRTAQMLRHYGRSAVAERARASHKRLFETAR